MSASLNAMKNSRTGSRSKRNFMPRPAFYRSLLPAAERFARRLVRRPDHESALRDRDRILGAFGHGHVRRAAVVGVGERQVFVIAPRQIPEVDARVLGELMHRARLALLGAHVAVTSR